MDTIIDNRIISTVPDMEQIAQFASNEHPNIVDEFLYSDELDRIVYITYNSTTRNTLYYSFLDKNITVREALTTLGYGHNIIIDEIYREMNVENYLDTPIFETPIAQFHFE
jgi:hypothetical protein